MNGQKPKPKTPVVSSSAKDDADDHPPMKWMKRVIAVASAIAAIGGAGTVIHQTTHWLDFLIHRSAPACPATQTERSPNLGISFYQNGRLDPMYYSDNIGTSQENAVNVCMKSGPFELWFPALGTGSALEVCTSGDGALFRDMFEQAGFNCLSPATGAADSNYASGTLFETSPQVLSHTEIVGSRAILASGGNQKYYVADLTTPGVTFRSRHAVRLATLNGKLYLVVYLANSGTFNTNDVEYFILSFNN